MADYYGMVQHKEGQKNGRLLGGMVQHKEGQKNGRLLSGSAHGSVGEGAVEPTPEQPT